MSVEDMNAEQEYFVERLRRHNRLFHGWGILCGLEVKPAATTQKPWQVCVFPVDACCPTGDEVHVSAPVPFDLARAPGPEDDVPCPCPPGPPMGSRASDVSVHYLAIRYLCRPARPVRTGHTECGCAESSCETSRYRDDFELALLIDLPVPYDEESVKQETRPCARTSVDPWVILSTVTGDLSHPPPAPPKPPTNIVLGATQPLSTLDAALTSALKDDKRRQLPRVEDLLAAFRP